MGFFFHEHFSPPTHRDHSDDGQGGETVEPTLIPGTVTVEEEVDGGVGGGPGTPTFPPSSPHSSTPGDPRGVKGYRRGGSGEIG